MPKYTISITACPTEVRMYEADSELVKRCLDSEDLNSFFGDYDFEEGGSCYYEERELLTYTSDFHLEVKDEEDNVVFETEDFSDIRLVGGEDEDGDELVGWDFKGIDDGNYLISVDLIKREWWEGELEIEEEFDPAKLFYLKSRRFDDEFPYIGDDVADIWDLHYGDIDIIEDSDCSSTLIDLDGGDNSGSYGWDAYIVNCQNKNEWEEIEEMPEDESAQEESAIAFCPMCGSKVNGTDPFCPECGAALIDNQISKLQTDLDLQMNDLTSTLDQMLKNM